MAKQPNVKTNMRTKKKLITTIIAVALIVLSLFGLRVVIDQIRYYQEAAEAAGTVSIRELVINAVDGLKQPAVIDAKTGDTYFPGTDLYLPYNKDARGLQYSLEYGDKDDVVALHVTEGGFLSQAKVKLYSAQDVKTLFDHVPHLQACSRGIVLSYSPTPSNDGTPAGTIGLNNGKTLHIFTENGCPGLNDKLLPVLKQIRAQ